MPKQGLPPVARKLNLSYTAARELFHPERVEKAVKNAIPEADLNLSLALFILSGLIIFVMALLTSIESVYLANFASELISEVSGVPQPRLELESLAPVVAYQFTVYLILGTAVALAAEGIVFGIFSLSGGKGKFEEQLFVSSIIALAFSFTSVLSLFMPLFPPVNVVAGAAIIAVTAYFAFYVTLKAYSVVHGISYTHALVVVLIIGLARLAVLYFLMGNLAAFFGLSNPTELAGV